jgi:hypothetical protein
LISNELNEIVSVFFSIIRNPNFCFHQIFTDDPDSCYN